MVNFNFQLNVRFSLIFLVLISLASFIIYDVRSNGLHQKSRVGRVLHQSGAINLYNNLQKQFQTHVPHVIKSINEFCLPYQQKAHQFFKIVGDFFYTLCEPLIPIVKTITPDPKVTKAAFEELGSRLRQESNRIFANLEHYVYASHKVAREYILHAGSWVRENLQFDSKSIESVQTTLAEFTRRLQSSCVQFYTWAYKALLG